MMKEIVGLVVGIPMALYSLYFFLPLLSSEHAATQSFFNQTDPVIAQANDFGQGWFLVLPLAGIFVGAFLFISIALRRSQFE